MRIWPALLLAPLLALASIGFGYALVPPACSVEGRWMLHALPLACLVISVGATMVAFSEKRKYPDPFLPLIAVWSGAFFSLVIAAQWATQLFLSPCIP
jgi:hypothetical protein